MAAAPASKPRHLPNPCSLSQPFSPDHSVGACQLLLPFWSVLVSPAPLTRNSAREMEISHCLESALQVHLGAPTFQAQSYSEVSPICSFGYGVRLQSSSIWPHISPLIFTRIMEAITILVRPSTFLDRYSYQDVILQKYLDPVQLQSDSHVLLQIL